MITDPEKAFFWLNKFPVLTNHTVQIFIEKLHKAHKDGKSSLPQSDLTDLIEVCDQTSSRLERASARLECAWAAQRLGNLHHAKKYLFDALLLLNEINDPLYKHQRAIAYWMLGCLLKLSACSRKDILIAWEQSLQMLEAITCDPDLPPRELPWYQVRCERMHKEIHQFLHMKHTANRKVHLKTVSLITNKLKDVNVIASIAAGDFKPTGVESASPETISIRSGMDAFEIEGLSHKLYNLRDDSSQIRLNPTREHYILHVNGNSMNAAGIDWADYVLMRFQEDADSGDIVAAEIVDIDSEATLKRFTRVENQVSLKPESHDPKYTAFPNAEHPSLDFHIRGIALGVFKPE